MDKAFVNSGKPEIEQEIADGPDNTVCVLKNSGHVLC